MLEVHMTPEEFVNSIQPDKITGYLIDVYQETSRVVSVQRELKSYHQLLDCDCISIQERQIGFKTLRNPFPRCFDIICDDNALARETVKISAIDNLGAAMLVGNLLIVKRGQEGEEVSLTPEDVAYLDEYIRMQGTRKFPRAYPMLHQCEYC